MRRDNAERQEMTGVRGVSQRTNAQTSEYLMDLTLDELVRTVTAINSGALVART